jgi:hypothetical protein
MDTALDVPLRLVAGEVVELVVLPHAIIIARTIAYQCNPLFPPGKLGPSPASDISHNVTRERGRSASCRNFAEH